MKTLSDSQTNQVITWVRSQHLTIPSLENEFIDHICCDIEELMDRGSGFSSAFESIRKALGDDVLTALEKETILKLTYNQRIMKLLTKITGITVLLLFIAAIITRLFGVKTWETIMGGGMLVLALGFAPLFFIGHYRDQEVKEQKVLHILGFLSAFLIPLGSFLGLLNSSYALMVIGAGVLFLLAGFIPLSWISVPRGSTRTAVTGSLIFLLFFILLSMGFMGVRISKDTVDNWIFFSQSTQGTAELYESINNTTLENLKTDSSASVAAGIDERSDKMVQQLVTLRDDFIRELAPGYRPGDKYFKGMDDHFAGKKLLINKEQTHIALRELGEYEEFLLTVLSRENELVKGDISKLLKIKQYGGDADFTGQENYLFRDFPAISDVAVINSLILNVRIAEFKALQFIGKK
jgi:hypothetical protein